MAAGALVLGAAVTVREIGAVLIVPVVVFAALTVPGWRRQLAAEQRRGLAAGCFLLPVLGYLAGTFAVTGHFGMAGNGPSPQYGRAAAAADCATLEGPRRRSGRCARHRRRPWRWAASTGCCTTRARPGTPCRSRPASPATSSSTGSRWPSSGSSRCGWPRRSPGDSVRLFAPVRDDDPQVTPIARWQFQDFYPTYPRRYSMAFLTRLAHAHGSGGDLVAVQPAASFLRAYQLGGGLHAGAAVRGLPGVAGVAGALRRRTGLRLPCLLVTLAAVVLLVSSDAFEFSWRYQLPAVVLLPLAGDAGGHRPDRAAQGQTIPLRGTFRLIRYAFTIVSTQALPSP